MGSNAPCLAHGADTLLLLLLISIFFFFVFLFRRLFWPPWLRLMEVSFRVGSTLRCFMLTMCAILMASHIQKVPE